MKRPTSLSSARGKSTDRVLMSIITDRIVDFKPTAEKPFILGLPTGSSPIPTYKHLIKLVKGGNLSQVSRVRYVCMRDMF